jgi:hypothetical protein
MGHYEFDSRDQAIRAVGGEHHTAKVKGSGYFDTGEYVLKRSKERYNLPAEGRPLDPFATDQGVGENVPAEGIDVVGMGRRVVAAPAPVAPAPRRAALNPFALEAGKEPGKGNFRTPVDQFLAAGERERVEGRKATAKASQEFDRLLIQYGPELGWVDNLDALAPQMETAKQDGTTIAARVARSKELNKLRYRAAAAFGLDAQNTNLDVRKRAELLPRLQEYVQQEVIPRRQAESLTAAIQPEAGKQPVNTGTLNVGDVLNIDGERVRVDAVDPDTGEVTLQDGTKFGRTVVADGQTLYVENVEPVETGTDFAPVEQKATDGTKANTALFGNPAGGYKRLPVVFVRSGKPPEGASGKFLSGQKVGTEKGVSVYEAWNDPKTGKFLLNDTASDAVEGVDESRPFYLVEGEVMPGETGSDGEPLLKPGTVRIVGEIKPADIVSTLERTIAMDGSELDDNQIPRVETASESPGSPLPASPVLDAPESVADQKARMAREEAQAKTKADREKLAERQAKPLTGSVGDIGQGDLLGGGDLFSAPAPERIRDDLPEAQPIKRQIDELVAEAERRHAAMAPGQTKDLTQPVDLLDAGDKAKLHSLQMRLRPKSQAEAKADVQRKRAAVLAKLESLKIDTAGKVFDAIQGIPVLVWNGALSAAQLAIRAGQRMAQAIDAAVTHIRARHRGAFDEAAVRAELERDLLGPLRLDTATPLPDFQPYAVAQRIFTQPFGAETLPWIGRLFGPRGKRVLTEVDRAVVTHAAENGVGKAVAAGIGTELAGRVDAVFRPNDAGDLNVTPRTPGQSLKVADVLEALQRDPTSYTLTAEQRVAWERVLQPLLKLRARLVERYGLATTQDADGDLLAYFPRIVIETPNTPDNEQRPGGASVGGRQGFQKSRAFRTERQGWEAGYRYEPSIERRLVTAIERLYKAMADQRLANNPALAGRTRTEVVAELMEWHAEELGAGLMTEAEIQRKADGIMSRGSVNLPAFAGRTFAVPNAGGPGMDLSLTQQLDRAFPRSESRLRDLLVRGNNAVKAVRLGFDLGAPLVQGLPVFFRDPVTWGRATGASLRALFSPVGLARMLQTPENRQAVRELAQVGSPIGSLPEMLAGLGRGELLDRIPVFRGVRAAFGRQFSTFMDVAKLELWKAHRGLYPQSQWSELAQSLEALLLSGRMDSVGVGRTQALTERVLLLAPSYYRGAVNLVSLAARPGVSGQIARRALLHFGAGMLTTFVGVGLALGMGEDELKRRLDPTHPQFLQWTVRPNEKRSVNLGFGGIFRSWVKLLGNMVRTSLDTPGDWLALDSQRNPLARWLRGHLAPIPALAMDLTGRDFMGRQNDLTDVPAQLLPLWAAQMVDKTGQLPPTWRELTASWTGLSGYSQTPFQYIRSRAARWDADRLRAQGQPPPGKRMPEESPYARLEWALRLENYPAARKEYETLITRLPPAPGKTPQRMILEHFRNAAQDGGFVQYRAQENDFRKSLSREERDLYDLARKEQRDLFVRLRRTLSAP